jgi:hypothetical protein
MRRLTHRIVRLERSQQTEPPAQKTFYEALADFAALDHWLAERGYADHLAAIEAGETGPPGLEALLREYAGYDPSHRAFRRVETALEAGELPDDADVCLLAEDIGRSGGS